MFRLACLALALILTAPIAGFASSVEPATPIDRPPPSYPDSAGISLGHVKIQFTIDAEGRVQDPHVLESAPPGLFDAAALSAMTAWRYQPRRVDGRPVPQPSNTIALDFAPAPLDPAHTAIMINSDPPYYPREAYAAGQEGDVVVAFDINENGLVRNARAAQSTLAKVFDESAVSAIKNSRFRPPMVNGAPSAALGLMVTVPFRLATAVIAPKVLHRPSLAFPEKARQAGEQGYCYVSQAIAGDGTVEKVDVVAMAPGDVFQRACSDYASSFRFEPPDQDPTGRVGRKHSLTISFLLDGATPLLQPGQWVKIRYTVGTDGQMKDLEVIGVSGPEIYPSKVLNALRRRKVQPIVENGLAVEKPGQIVIVSGDQD